MATAQKLITAEEFGRMPDTGRPVELVRGVLVEMNMPKPRHGQVCRRMQALVGNYCDERQLGHVLSNDAGVVTERNPDTVRGADASFYPYSKLPPGPLGNDYLPFAPDVVFEVLSPDDRPLRVMQKTREYLGAGVRAVVIMDPATNEVEVHRSDGSVETLQVDDDLRLPELDDDFCIPVQRFFL